jgi:hypothetical protein
MFQFKDYTREKRFDRPMRRTQLTLNDDDPGTFEPNKWLEYFRDIKARGAFIGT